MKKTVSKIFAALILVCFSLSLVSCGGSLTDEAVKQILEEKLPLSYEMNEILWGKGLETEDGSDRYRTVIGFDSVEQLLDKAGEVFAKEYVEVIRDSIFNDENEDISPRYKMINGKLKKDTLNEGYNVRGNIVISSAHIVKQNRAMAVVEADYEDGGKADLTLILQDGVWLFNSPTY